MAQKQESFFWTSYSDLMTSLFFVMLVLFVLVTVMLKDKIDKTEKDAEATRTELNKIKEIEDAIQNIDPNFFVYNKQHKKHILNISVQFRKNSSNFDDFSPYQRQQLLDAGRAIIDFMNKTSDEVKYLLIIEGQSSKDWYVLNDELSFKRANALKHFWARHGIKFGEKCEVIVSGSGQNGALRIEPDNAENTANQRFLIHIIPKPGIIDTFGTKKRKHL